jgi:hypothetical protein
MLPYGLGNIIKIIISLIIGTGSSFGGVKSARE